LQQILKKLNNPYYLSHLNKESRDKTKTRTETLSEVGQVHKPKLKSFLTVLSKRTLALVEKLH
jgi:hypothetical protein